MSLENSPIGVFDSGIGGLTVLRALTETMPHESFIYFGDTARVPYGTKSGPVVKQFALQDSFFLLKYNVKLIVAACNTASAVALDFLCQRLSVPVIGVIEPGAKAAVDSCRDKPIGVIGTDATISSKSYQKHLRAMKPDVKVLVKPCPLFVPMIEEGLTKGKIPRMVVEHYLAELKEVGSLILGCTHYPLLQGAIADFMGAEVEIVDSPRATAETVKNELAVRGMLKQEGEPEIGFFASDISPGFLEQSSRFFGGELPKVEKVEFEVADFWV